MSHKSFTLVELLVVIAIIGLLATVVMVSVGGAGEKAKDAKRKADFDALKKALEMYYIDEGEYPGEAYCDSSKGSCGDVCTQCATGDGWSTNSSIYKALVPKYLSEMPVDPTNSLKDGHYYIYEPKNHTKDACISVNLANGGWYDIKLGTPPYQCVHWSL